MVKNLPALQETWVRSLGWEDPLKKEMATHSSILAWRIPCTEEPDRLQSMGSQRRHNLATKPSENMIPVTKLDDEANITSPVSLTPQPVFPIAIVTITALGIDNLSVQKQGDGKLILTDSYF